MCARRDNDVTRGEMSINTYTARLNDILRQEGEAPADHATAQHYFLLGVMPAPAFERIRATRGIAQDSSQSDPPENGRAETVGVALGALAGATDDLHRAALILRQIASGTSERIGRSPEDYRRIAGQLSDRAKACKAAEDALAAGLSSSTRPGTTG